MAYEKLLPIVMCFIKTLNTPFTVACYPSYQGRLRGGGRSLRPIWLRGKEIKRMYKDLYFIFYTFFYALRLHAFASLHHLHDDSTLAC